MPPSAMRVCIISGRKNWPVLLNQVISLAIFVLPLARSFSTSPIFFKGVKLEKNRTKGYIMIIGKPAAI